MSEAASEQITLYTVRPEFVHHLYQRQPYRKIVGVQTADMPEPLVAPEHAEQFEVSTPETFPVIPQLGQGILVCYDRYYANRERRARNCHVGAIAITSMQPTLPPEARDRANQIVRGGFRVRRLRPSEHGVIGAFDGMGNGIGLHSQVGLVDGLVVQIDDVNAPMSIGTAALNLDFYQVRGRQTALYVAH